LEKPLRKIHKYPDKLAIGLMILETVSKTMHENQAEKLNDSVEIFDVLTSSIERLNDIDNDELIIFINFFLHLFRILGFEINFNNGVYEDNGYLKFSINNGMIISNSSGTGRIYKISNNNWKFLESVYKSGTESVKQQNFNFTQIYDFFMIYIGFHLEKSFDLKSKSILMI
jgi:DNA repair protein RecO